MCIRQLHGTTIGLSKVRVTTRGKPQQRGIVPFRVTILNCMDSLNSMGGDNLKKGPEKSHLNAKMAKRSGPRLAFVSFFHAIEGAMLADFTVPLSLYQNIMIKLDPAYRYAGYRYAIIAIYRYRDDGMHHPIILISPGKYVDGENNDNGCDRISRALVWMRIRGPELIQKM
jgi:hypothetical protein